MIQALFADRSDDALRLGVLPGYTVRWAVVHQPRRSVRREGPIQPSLRRGCGWIGPSLQAEV